MSAITFNSWTRYYNLTKPKVVYLIVFTAMVGMLLASDGTVSLDIFVFGLLGIGLAAASGAAINHVVDEHIDRIMERTRNRPLVSGELDQKSALIFALAIGTLGIAMLVVFVNFLTALLTFFSLVGYALIYTMYLKRATPQNIVLGGASITTVHTIVLRRGSEYHIFINGRFAYSLDNPSMKFYDDLKDHHLMGKAEYEKKPEIYTDRDG